MLSENIRKQFFLITFSEKFADLNNETFHWQNVDSKF